MKLLISADRKTRGDRIRNQILKELEFKICYELDEKQLKQLDRVIRMIQRGYCEGCQNYNLKE
jgi:hypothetical protein